MRRIASQGHEIASHGYGHERASDLDRMGFRADIERAKGVLEDLAGTEVTGYRAPSFSIGPGNLWALDSLARCPDARYWQGENQFGFVALRPPHLLPDQAMPHLRLDQVLEFLLGDKLR